MIGKSSKVIYNLIMKIINNRLDIKLGQYTEEGPRKIKNRKAAGLEIPTEVWKTRKFDDLLLRYFNAVYDQNMTERWTKGYIPPFPRKVTSELPSTTLTSIAAKIYMFYFSTASNQKLRKFFGRIKMVCEETDQQHHNPSNLRRSSC